MSKWMQHAVFDNVMEMAFSSPSGFLRHGEDVGGLIASLHVLLNAAQIFGLIPIIMKFLHLPWVNKNIGFQPSDKSGPGRVRGVCLPQDFPSME